MNDRDLLCQGLETLGLYDPQAVDKLLAFSRLLLEKNKVMNLTAVTDPDEVVTRHFLDCAALAPWVSGEPPRQVIDVGCGAGFPGMPLALLTNARMTLLDSLNKRVAFLQEAISALGVDNAQAVHARAEAFGHREAFDVATSRAVARLNVLAELCLPLVKVGGCFLAMKAADCAEEVQEAEAAVRLLGGEIERVQAYSVPLTDLSRRLVVVRKLSPTPEKYPRRFAKITAAPLGA